MKRQYAGRTTAFTLIELLVVMTIIAIMMSLAATVLRDPGTGRTLDSGVDLVASMIEEARATAQGNDTYTRLVIVNDPSDTGANSRHLRYMVVQMLKRDLKENGTYDASNVSIQGKWVSTSAGAMLPAGVYFSPSYSKSLSWAEGSTNRIGSALSPIGKKRKTRVYYFEFDEKGRFVAPGADPSSPPQPQRIILVHARRGIGAGAVDGLVPLQQDKQHRPIGVKGLVVWPTGYTTLLRTRSQMFE